MMFNGTADLSLFIHKGLCHHWLSLEQSRTQTELSSPLSPARGFPDEIFVAVGRDLGIQGQAAAPVGQGAEAKGQERRAQESERRFWTHACLSVARVTCPKPQCVWNRDAELMLPREGVTVGVTVTRSSFLWVGGP